MSKPKYYVIINRSAVDKQGTRVKLKHYRHGALLDYIEDHKEEVDTIHEENEEAEPVRFVNDPKWIAISRNLGKFEIKTLQVLRSNGSYYLGISHEENIQVVKDAIRTGKESDQVRKNKALEERVDAVFSTRTSNLIKYLLEKGRNNYTPLKAKHAQLKDVLLLYPEELLLVPGFGPKRVNEVINVLNTRELITPEQVQYTKQVLENYKNEKQ